LSGAVPVEECAYVGLDPQNDALKRADDLLRSAFPIEPCLPGDMALQVRKLDQETK
jgi:hypothetical protein